MPVRFSYPQVHMRSKTAIFSPDAGTVTQVEDDMDIVPHERYA